MRFISLLILCLFASPSLASGWNDYELEIAPGYTIFRANSLDVMLCESGGGIVLSPTDYPKVGPIVEYAVTDTYILTCHIGRQPRNLFAGDTFEDLDPTQKFFFLVRKADHNITGPLTQSEFEAHPVVQSISQITWEMPHNPNILLPLFGSLFFLAFTLVIFGTPALLGVLLLAIPIMIWRRWKNRAGV